MLSASLRLGCLLVLSSLVGSCGFQLRGDVQLAPGLSPLHIADSGSPALRSEIRAMLRSSGVALARQPESAAAVLEIERASQSRRVLSVDAQGRAREYEVLYSVRYRVRRNDKPQLARTVRLSREILFDADSVLALDYETRSLYRDMQRDAARLILQQLQALE